MMTSQVSFKTLGFAVGAALLTLPATAVLAQTTGGSAGGVQQGDLSASTYGSGTTDGSSLGVTGGGEASAANGGTASTSSDAKLNERRAMQRSVAVARDDDERARSRTRTTVRNGGDVRSRTMSIYKADGEKPVITRDSSVTNADGTVRKGK
jgi:hypothetical protein